MLAGDAVAPPLTKCDAKPLGEDVVVGSMVKAMLQQMELTDDDDDWMSEGLDKRQVLEQLRACGPFHKLFKKSEVTG